MNGKVVAICVAPNAGSVMETRKKVRAIVGKGLEGDRYFRGTGSFNKGQGRHQVTLINSRFFSGSGFSHLESRRNIVTSDVELYWLIGREFQIGNATFRGVKYCEPCERPSKLAGKKESFKKIFEDCGGITAEVIKGGEVWIGCEIIPPPKEY